jgi:hypothetical protein
MIGAAQSFKEKLTVSRVWMQVNSAPPKAGNSWDAASMQNPQVGSHQMQQNQYQGGLQQGSIGSIPPQPSTTTHFPKGQPPQSLQGQHGQTQKGKSATPLHVFQPPGPPTMKPGPQWRTGKLQIPTNPRIASNFIGKGNSGLESNQKPAYVSVGSKAGKLSSDDVTDATLQVQPLTLASK